MGRWPTALLHYCYWTSQPWDELTGTERLSPTAAAWTRFWADLRDIGIERWSARYETPGVMDGTHWSVELASSELTVSTHGSNCYPTAAVLSDDLEVVDAGSPDTAAVWDALCEAVKRLSGREFR